ncbi:MAG: S1 RNA-binding domain-containing protein [Ilumatobacteraceae bacterium]
MLIIDPPTAELGATYTGRVVNVTKFGAFVNILPGRDGLVHISKLGKGKRINRVEDVLNLGDTIEVVVEEIDGKRQDQPDPAGDLPESADGSAPSPAAARSEGGAVAVSFEGSSTRNFAASSATSARPPPCRRPTTGSLRQLPGRPSPSPLIPPATSPSPSR